jgi:histidinol-phosphatase
MKSDMLEFALMLARAAEAEIMPRFKKCAVSWKPDGSEVTEADRRAEEVMRDLISKHSPETAVLGEEYGGSRSDPMKPLWLLDPIDGTASFAVGLPVFGTLIGYVENGEPQVGVIHMPAMGETVYAVRGSGCWVAVSGCDAVRVHVSGVTKLEDAYVSAGSPNSSPTWNTVVSTRKLGAVLDRARKFRFISDCVQHALVAQGRVDAAVDPFVKPWDIAAIVPCIEEAGGIVTDLEGRREGVTWQPHLMTSSSAELHREILSVMQGGQA